jgi:hypothetical protein
MNLDAVLEALRNERDRLSRAIEALEGVGKRRGRPAGAKGKRKHHLTPEGRRRLSEAMRKRWAERRRRAA